MSRLICEHCKRPTRMRYDVGGWYVCRRCRAYCNLTTRCRWEDRARKLAEERAALAVGKEEK